MAEISSYFWPGMTRLLALGAQRHGACQALPQETSAGLVVSVNFLTFFLFWSKVLSELTFPTSPASRNTGVSLIKLPP